MKYIILIRLILAINLSSNAQSCTDFYYMQNNKTVEMTIHNKKGKEAGKSIYTISNVSTTGGVTTSTINSEFIDAKGKSISKATNKIKCSNGIIMMDMKMFIPSAQQEQMGEASATVNDVYIEYPSSMKEGDALNDGEFKMDFKTAGGLGGSVAVNLTNRKVAGKETVTTPAGTWDCYKITYHSKIVMKIGIGIPVNSDVTESYAPGFGVVKTEAGGGKTEITEIK